MKKNHIVVSIQPYFVFPLLLRDTYCEAQIAVAWSTTNESRRWCHGLWTTLSRILLLYLLNRLTGWLYFCDSPVNSGTLVIGLTSLNFVHSLRVEVAQIAAIDHQQRRRTYHQIISYCASLDTACQVRPSQIEAPPHLSIRQAPVIGASKLLSVWVPNFVVVERQNY